MKVQLRNKFTQQIKEVKLGYSWTTLFWGLFPALFRQDWIGALVIGIINIFVSAFTYGTGLIIIDAIIAAFYNKNYIKRQLMNGWEPANDTSKQSIKMAGIYIPQFDSKEAK